MFSVVVVGTDGSETAGRAVASAAQLAGEMGATLHILSAYGPTMRRDLDRLAHGGGSVQAVLDDAAASVAEAGCRVEAHELSGDPAEAIMGFAYDNDADLIVIGNKGLGGVKGMLGSVPAKIVKQSPCSVLIVKTTD